MTRGSGETASTDPPRLDDPGEVEREITAFVREAVARAGADGVVVNLSGGVDSTVTATLAAEALGSENVCGLVLPADANADGNVYDAHRIAEELVIDYHVLDVQPILDAFARTTSGGADANERALGNAAARIRMLIAYFVANVTSRLVVGTTNRTELLLGYFTKHGDGAADLLPIGDLYKTEVGRLARHLDVPEFVLEGPSTAGLWVGQTDEADLGASYETIDPILHRLVDCDLGIEGVATDLGVDRDLVERLAERHARSRHKRGRPRTPSEGADRPRSEYFYDLELRFSDSEGG